MNKRVFLIVLDSLGIGEAPDAADFGDYECNTLARISADPLFSCPNLRSLGLANIDGQGYLGPVEAPKAAYARLRELSRGKDTTIGHWELAGLVSEAPLPTYPEGFPQEIIDAFSRMTGRGVLCNKPYSGTEVIKDYGAAHMAFGDWIVYTSADSVFQIAAHEDIVPLEELYQACRSARAILQGPNGVGRVIARPFTGPDPEHFVRTDNRHDFSLKPPAPTMLDAIQDSGQSVYAIGKIHDIFAGQGITEYVYTANNLDGMQKTLEALDKDFQGLCFVNLVDFDSKYGHRQDVSGYAAALAEFDAWLPRFLARMRRDDVLMICADHGCDPGDSHTDHSREYVPFLVYGSEVHPGNHGTKPTFATVAATVCDYLEVPFDCVGSSLLQEPALEIPSAEADPPGEEEALCQKALQMMEMAYAPYSSYLVGASLECEDGTVYTGCNIENASFTPTVCAERVALFKAVSEGKTRFRRIAICGGREGNIQEIFPPCGVCRQALSEFCSPSLEVLLIESASPLAYQKVTLGDLLPLAFTPDNMAD